MLRPIRILLALFYFCLASLLSLPFLLVRPFHRNNTAKVAHLYSWGVIPLLGVKIEYENKQELDNIHSSLIISNHQDTLDIFLMGHCFPSGTIGIGKKQLIFVPLLGQIFWLTGNILIDRGNSQKSVASLEYAQKIMAHGGRNIWIMPEGTRSLGRGLLPFKKGSFHLAINAQVPIRPIIFSDYYHQFNLNAWRSVVIKIAVLDPIPTQGLTPEDVPGLQELTRSKIQEKIEEMRS